MYTRFNTDTIVTKFIKSLLANTNIPQVNVWMPGGYVIKGNTYITNDNILYCNGSGYPRSVIDEKDGKRYLTVLGEFVPGRRYYNITSPYISKTKVYDAETHYYLGQYLRFYRDYYNLDLMTMYNCFANQFIDHVDIKLVEKRPKVVTDDLSVQYYSQTNSYKIAAVPIKYDKIYNISLDCNFPIEIMCGYWGPKGLIDVAGADLSSTYRKILSSRFKDPVEYKSISLQLFSDEFMPTLSQYEKYFTLFIKMPQGLETSIVVVESNLGRETTQISRSTVSVQGTDKTCDTVLMSTGRPAERIFTHQGTSKRCVEIPLQYCQSPLGLLRQSDTTTYAFSDRLIEYLLQNVITPMDEVGLNTQRIQEFVSSRSVSNKHKIPKYTVGYTNGVWDDSLQEYIYGLVSRKLKPGVEFVDINGYVDKDSEVLLRGGN